MEHAKKTPDRWLVVAGAILIQLALGAIYAWSVFTARLTDAAGAYAFSASQTAWVFSTGLATFAIVMVLAGRVLPRVGPRQLIRGRRPAAGRWLLLGGLFGDSFWMQLTVHRPGRWCRHRPCLRRADLGLRQVVPGQEGPDHRPGRGRFRFRRDHLGQARRLLVRRPA